MKKIILAEPHTNHRSIFANILRRKDTAIFTFNSYLVTKKALMDCTEDNLPDMLIIGYGISYNHTLELLKIIKEKNLSFKMKIFKISSDITPEMGYKLIEAGVNDYMNLAAFTKELLIEKIDTLFNQENLLKRIRPKIKKPTRTFWKDPNESEIALSS